MEIKFRKILDLLSSPPKHLVPFFFFILARCSVASSHFTIFTVGSEDFDGTKLPSIDGFVALKEDVY